MKIDQIWIDALVIGDRLRAVDETKVAALAESMGTIGLQQPISVWFDDDDAMHLVTGLHRVRAAERLDWEQIDAITVEMDAVDRELWEISENLHRVDLTKDERDEHIRRYAELLEKRRENQVTQNDTPEIGYKKPPPQKKGVAKQIADETGLSKSTVNRVLNPAPPKPVSPPEPARNPDEAFNQWCQQMNRLWSRAPLEWRERWLAMNERPVFDKTSAGTVQ